MKKIIALMIGFAMLACLLASCAGQSGETGTDPSADASTAAQDTSLSEIFSDGDYKDVTAETPNAEIVLSGAQGTLSDTTRGASGSTVTVTSKGIYHVTGSAENVTILVQDENESGNIYLVLDNVTMTNATGACIYVENADKVILQCVGENSLTSTGDAAVYTKDDLTVNGSGSLNVTSTDSDGIHCGNDLKITGASVTVNAAKIGLDAGDSVCIGGGTVNVTAQHDGVQIANDTSDALFYMEKGSLTVNAGYDGISVAGDITVSDGSLSVTAGGGAQNAKDSNTSQKGLKCDGSLSVSGGEISVSSADDAVHTGFGVAISGGALTLASSDDGVHADGGIAVSGGSLTVTKSYEGLEAETVTIAGGSVSVTASDDGVNAAGGSDSASTENNTWGGSATGTLTVSGGEIYVNAEGDGLDSNGSIYITGGTVIVEGPTGSGNGALDYGDGADCVCSVTGGTVLALGSTGMAVNFNAGTQCAALVSLSGSAGDTVTVDDGTGFTFTATKSFQCAVYSSSGLQQGGSYTITAGSGSAAMDFTSGLYYSILSGMGGMAGRGR